MRSCLDSQEQHDQTGALTAAYNDRKTMSAEPMVIVIRILLFYSSLVALKSLFSLDNWLEADSCVDSKMPFMKIVTTANDDSAMLCSLNSDVQGEVTPCILDENNKMMLEYMWGKIFCTGTHSLQANSVAVFDHSHPGKESQEHSAVDDTMS